jgi:hypothetical protein
MEMEIETFSIPLFSPHVKYYLKVTKYLRPLNLREMFIFHLILPLQIRHPPCFRSLRRVLVLYLSLHFLIDLKGF